MKNRIHPTRSTHLIVLAISEFDEPLETNFHDTEIEGRIITTELTDCVLTFDVDEVVAVWNYTHSFADFGLED